MSEVGMSKKELALSISLGNALRLSFFLILTIDHIHNQRWMYNYIDLDKVG